jgi:hypothetical protein
MNPKARPNHKLYVQALRNLSAEQKLAKVFELSAFARNLFVHGLRKRLPHASEEEFRRILLARLDKCHNRNY